MREEKIKELADAARQLEIKHIELLTTFARLIKEAEDERRNRAQY